MATQHISGVVALMLQARTSLQPNLVKEALTATATPIALKRGGLRRLL
ncbi:MAG TPA: S8 family serine peptidase [Roseiflexaceae bacterium]|nr:S8 family serine peptidase [Roseiflexaceae bacterium]